MVHMQTKITKVFFIANFILTTLLSFTYLLFNSNYRVYDFIFTVLALISTTATLYLIYFILSRVFFKFKPTIYFLSFLFTLTNIALVGDIILYKTWGFHINGMVINIITSPASYDSLFVSSLSALIIFSIVVFLILFQFYSLKKISGLNENILITINTKINLILLPILFLIIVYEKLTYAFANFNANSYILERTKVVPLYQPLTMNKFLINVLGMKPVKTNGSKVNISKITNIEYPKNPIKIKDQASKPNIFIFGVDALRETILSKENTPHIMQFANDNINFVHNISGGNCTRFGLFSIFYGINSNYWFGFLNAQKGSVLFDVMKKLDYQISLVSSANFTWPEFRKTAFYNVQEKIKDDFKGNSAEKDRQTIDYFKSWIDKQDKSKPIFSFVWLDSVHSRAYPANFKKFVPADGGGYITATPEDHEQHFNRYKNAVLYSDSLFGEFITKLKSKNLYENSIIILISDHGEEFFEHGFYSHNSAYDFEQVGSPLIMRVPGEKSKVVTTMTSHLDIVPTLMHKLGVTNEVKDYAQGFDLLDNSYKRRCTFIGNWNENAVVCNDYTIVISNIITKSFNNDVRDSTTYNKLSDYNRTYVNQILLDTLKANKQFKNRVEATKNQL